MTKLSTVAIATIVVFGAVVGGTSAAVQATSGKQGSEATPTNVGVGMTEFRFRLSKASVPKGKPVRFNIVNNGRIVHDFDIVGIKNMPIIAPKKKYFYTVTFKRAGRFRYICTVPKHAGYGMSGYLAVK